MVPIRENLLPTGKYDLKVPYESCEKDMKWIVVHNSGNNAPADNEVAYMIRNSSSTSFNVAVDDREIVVGIPTGRGAFAAGSRDHNAHGVHVEICYSLDDADLPKFKKAEENAAEYIASLLRERGWDTSRVIAHRDCDGKYCPHRTLDLGWARFIKMIQAHMDKSAPDELYRVRKTWADAASQIGAYRNFENAKNTCKTGYTVFDSAGEPCYTPPSSTGAQGEFVPYTVRSACDVLNIRTGPGTGYTIAGQIRDKHLYTIVAESAGQGSAKGWGRLKSGAGWVALDWVQKVE